MLGWPDLRVWPVVIHVALDVPGNGFETSGINYYENAQNLAQYQKGLKFKKISAACGGLSIRQSKTHRSKKSYVRFMGQKCPIIGKS
jgi:hypothetical protein